MPRDTPIAGLRQTTSYPSERKQLITIHVPTQVTGQAAPNTGAKERLAKGKQTKHLDIHIDNALSPVLDSRAIEEV